MATKTRVLLADDSGFMRMVLSDIINHHAHMQVIDTAENGKEALEKTIALRPDVVLMDLNMKDYDGLYAVKNIMAQLPTPIIMLSSMGNTYPDAYVEALNEGAVDFLNKPIGIINSKIREIEEQIYTKIKQAAGINTHNLTKKKITTNHHRHTFLPKLAFDIIVIGASTGGTGAIEQILLKLPENFPLPIVIAQHMPEEFVHSFAARLNELIPLQVKVAGNDESIVNGNVYILPGNANLKLSKSVQKVRFSNTSEHFEEFNHPSVDCLFSSAAHVYGKSAIGILLTGMGRDGAKGLLAIKSAGGFTVAQNEATSVVWGMPKAAIDLSAANHILPVQEVAGFVVGAIS